MEEGEINSWEQVRIHKGKNGRKKERTEILPPGRTSETIYYSSFDEHNEGNQCTSVPFDNRLFRR